MSEFRLYGKTLVKVDNAGKERIVSRFKDLKIAKAYCKSSNLVIKHPMMRKREKGILDLVTDHI